MHCDPHPANVLVRPLPDGSGRPQLVLLDHGLYQQLDTQFRLQYCTLWRGIVLAEVAVIRRSCLELGVGNLYPLLAAMLTAKPWNDIVAPELDSLVSKTKPTSAAKHDAKVSGYVQQYAAYICEVLSKVPPQMLLLFKANDCLRHSDRMLGTPINTFLITARACVAALSAARWESEPSLRSLWIGWWDWLQLEVRLGLFQLSQHMLKWG